MKMQKVATGERIDMSLALYFLVHKQGAWKLSAAVLYGQ
jgi:hypothetical protein